MKKFTGLLLFLLAGILFADQIDVTQSRGTEQSVIVSLNPAPASPEVKLRSQKLRSQVTMTTYLLFLFITSYTTYYSIPISFGSK